MSAVLQFEQRKKLNEIDPDLKGFIDRVIVPILVKEYLELAESEADGANSVSSTAAPLPGERDGTP